MAVYQCARGCSRLVSVSAVPGGNPVALADPEGYATRYVRCAGCGRHVCDRCAAQPPPVAAPGPCPWCGGALAWEGTAVGGAARSVPPTQQMAFAARHAAVAQHAPSPYSPAAQHAPRAHAAASAHALPGASSPSDASASVPWSVAWWGSGGKRYRRTAPAATIHAELPAVDALARERARVGGWFGWTAVAAIVGALPATFVVGEMIDDDLAPPVLALFAALFIVSLAVWWVIAPALSVPGRFGDLDALIAKLRLAPGSDVSVTLLGAAEGRWLELGATLASGVRLSAVRKQDKTFVSSTRIGNTIRTTYSITADDTVTLSFEAGRFPRGQVEAAAQVLRQKLAAAAGGRLVVRGTATELTLTFPAMVRPVIDPVARSIPPLVTLLHGLLDGTPVVDENAVPPHTPTKERPATPANGGMLGMLGAPLGIAVSLGVLALGLSGVTIGGAAYAYDRYLSRRAIELYQEERALEGPYRSYGYGYGGAPRDPATEQRLSEIRRELDSIYDQDDYAEIASLACGAAGCLFSGAGPALVLLSALGFMRRRRAGL